MDHNLAYFDYLLKELEISAPCLVENDLLVKKLLNTLYEKKSKSNLYYAPLLPRINDPFLPYQDNSNSSFCFTEKLLASEFLQRYLEDEEENTFLNFFLRKKIPDQILNGDHDLLGLSVVSPSQMIPVLTLCNLIKEKRKDFPIILGGQWPSLFRMELAKWPKLSRWIDGVIFDEGETPLYEYLQMLEGKQSISQVPNLFFFEKGKTRFNRKRTEEDMDQLPCPDFDGMPLERYASSEFNGFNTVTYQTSRECYWNRCTYCVDLPFPKHTYREKSVDLVMRDIRELQAKYGAGELVLSDLAMAPAYMRKLSRRILEEDIKIRWWTFSRMDGALNSEIFGMAHKAGCYRISYGFESANQRVCDFIDKGTKLETMSRVLKDCGSSGIKVTLQTMVGLPSETVEEAMDTISFLLEHRKYIDEVCYNIYYLTPGNFIYRDPQKHKLTLQGENRLPFQFFLDFEHADIETGIGRNKGKSLIRFYETQRDRLKRKDGLSLWSEEEDISQHAKPKLIGIAPVVISIEVGQDKAYYYIYSSKDKKESLMLDETNFAFLNKFDGKKSLTQIAKEMSLEKETAFESNLQFLKEDLCVNLKKYQLIHNLQTKQEIYGTPIRKSTIHNCP